MSELRELYQTLILDHNKNPRNFGVLENPSHSADGDNPLCGDVIHVTLRVEDDVVQDLRFEGAGCAISTASASLMTQAVKDRPVSEALALFEGFQELVTTDTPPEGTQFGKLAVFAGVREFPVRVKCATLPWHTLKNALKGSKDVARTE
ncbi:MAG: SUF system NifU family Fe-S cluster assembly protein [Myxococcota bacterium]|nr:SUF system NifU family Fe-S cluster assembly protein [Myxococcota bacterium]